MPRIHPKPEVFDGLLRLFPEERDRLLRLARRCSHCRAALAREPEVPATRDTGGQVLPWRPSRDEYGQTVDRVLTGFRPRVEAAARERAAAPSLLAELLEQAPERWEALVRGGERFRSLALCSLLLERSCQEGFEAPRQGEQLAVFALALVGLLDPDWYGERVLADARARCWMMIGNARRIEADLRSSEQAFQAAEAYFRQGTGDRLERAQLLTYKACLRRAQCRFLEAASLFRRAVSVFLEAGESHRAAEAIVGLALVERHRGEPERAILLLERASVFVDRWQDERLHGLIRFNQILCLVDANRPLEARAVLARSREVFRFRGERA
jgi:tetratricopeptide (TPR) repeat protein